MRENRLSYRETVRKYWGTKSKTEGNKYTGRVKLWERIYLQEGEQGLMTERLSGRWKHLKNRLFYGFLLFYSRFTVLLIFRFGENWGKQIFLYFV